MSATITNEQFALEVKEFIDKFGKEYGQNESCQAKQSPTRILIPLVSGSGLSLKEEALAVDKSRMLQRDLFEVGLGWISGPIDIGGRGLPSEYSRILSSELVANGFPDNSLIRTGTQVIGPSLDRYGNEVIRRQRLPKIHRGDELVCQLFSEPEAGSDLANIKTRADRKSGGWVLNGQKVWSSGALHSDLGLCVVRTEEGSLKHAGLSVFLIDMKSKGIDVRKIRQMTGGAEFCEVFLTDVFVDQEHLVGTLGDGWRVVIDVLMNERSSIGSELLPSEELIELLLKLCRELSESSSVTRDELASLVISYKVTKMLTQRLASNYREGEVPGPEMALTKIAICKVMSQMSHVAGLLLGPKIVADSGYPEAYAWSEFILGAPGMRIGGGTDEVLKNGVAERVLGMPRK